MSGLPTNIDDIPIVMTQQEVADFLRINIRTLKRWRNEKSDFPKGVNMGVNLVVFRKEEVLAWFNKLRNDLINQI